MLRILVSGVGPAIAYGRRPLCFLGEGFQVSLCNWFAIMIPGRNSFRFYFFIWTISQLGRLNTDVYIAVHMWGVGEECPYLKKMLSIIMYLKLFHFYD